VARIDKMSKLMENKQQMVHIASEIVVLTGLTFYFNQKNKKLMGHIEDLSQRVEEQEDLLQKHEQVIRNLVDFINQQQAQHRPELSVKTPDQQHTPPAHNQATVPPSAPVKPRLVRDSVLKKHHIKAPLVPPPKPTPTPSRVSFNPEPPQQRTIEELLSSEDESDLDAELVEELRELNESEDEEDIGLKKQQ
jgi:hypothetical protein